MSKNIIIRNIEPTDNVALAQVIRGALEEFGANKPGTVYFDPTTDHLYELFQTIGAIYYVALIDGVLVGGCGIFPTENLPEATCELVKLYLHKNARGTGLGKKLMLQSMQWAKENGEAGIVSGLYRKDGKDVPENPYEDEYIEGTDLRLWYIAQEIKTGPWKKIAIDDIGKDILKYLPDAKIKNILLHTPIYILLKNVSERNERAKNDPNYKGDERNPLSVLNQYTEKYEATKSKPDENEGDPTTVITKDGLTKLFEDNGLSEEDIDEVLNKLGITDDGDYYIKVKDSYLTPETQLVNVDSERTVYLKDIDKALK